jgi:DNA polymerase I-like protein with 3'-5' exonuclease and polymerase domains
VSAPPDVITIDFETKPIAQRPIYPPDPVGCAFHFPGTEPFYMAFDHPVGNNATRGQVQEMLHKAWDSQLGILCHHAKFDLAVAQERLALPALPWSRVHDSMFLAYLADPHARSLGLKPLAEDLLAWPADERNNLDAWIWEHRKSLTATYGAPVHKSKLGAWIFATPAALCGEYAVGDVARTRALFAHLWPVIHDNGMGEAYTRERRCLPIFMENERIGMRVDRERLERDIRILGTDFEFVEDSLRAVLRASGLNFDADADVASVLLDRGIVPRENWVETDKGGQLSMSKENLRPEHFTGPDGARIASALGYRNRLKTCLDMFMRPWAFQARNYNGYITTNWNQTRNAGESGGGTRTGRPSTDKHNFLNLSKSWDGKDDGYVHPAFLGVAPLPLVRRYIMPDDGQEFLHRDFDGQELRIFGHFERGALWDAYQRNPALDPHALVGAELSAVAGREIDRSRVKTLNFQAMYGGGVPALQRKLRCTTQEARELKAFHNKALPGRLILNEEITRVIRRGRPVRTIGGRLYFAEKPGPDGRDKIYKLINYLIQGSAADLTKQALIDWDEAKLEKDTRFLVTVYDEINITAAPKMVADREMAVLKEVMEAPRLGLTVPMRSSGKRGPNWGDLVKCP